MQTYRRTSGFRRAGGLLDKQVQKAAQRRGFAVSKLLTRWSEVVGEELAAICRPLKTTYPKTGIGATLTLLVRSAHAPEVQMHIPWMIDQVNACYGYRAIIAVKLSQTAPTGFAEGQAPFDAPPPSAKLRNSGQKASARVQERAAQATSDIENETLRRALANLGGHILSRTP